MAGLNFVSCCTLALLAYLSVARDEIFNFGSRYQLNLRHDVALSITTSLTHILRVSPQPTGHPDMVLHMQLCLATWEIQAETQGVCLIQCVRALRGPAR